MFDKADGATISEIALPGPPTGAAVTYMDNGRQYIVLATGYTDEARLVALSLPD